MASTIRVRAQAGDTVTEVQALVQHPMDSGFVKDSDGVLIPPHHIETLTFEHNGKIVLTADWGPAVSKDPYIKFSFAGGATGDTLIVTWLDNLGRTDTLEAKIT
jgi:sulfur-oxidizing protein SoxZ